MKKKLTQVVIAAMVTALLHTGCSTAPKLTAITLPNGMEDVELAAGESTTLHLQASFSAEGLDEGQITAAYAAAELQALSANEEVATAEIDAGTLTLTGKTPGQTAIEITGKNNLSLTLPVTVIDPVVPLTGIEVPQDLFVDMTGNGEEEAEEQPEVSAIEVKVTPADATGIAMEFTSSDEAVVTVDSEGVHTPVAEGQAIITTTVTGLDDDRQPVRFTAETAVTVGIKATSIGLAATEGWIYVGGAHQLAPYTLPAGAAEHTYSFASSDEAVATVSDTGYITGIGAGTATITITSEQDEALSIEYTITVNTYVAPRASNTGGGTNAGSGTAGAGNGTGTGATTAGNTNGGGGETPGGGNSGGGEAPAPPPDTGTPEPLTPLQPGDGTQGGGVGGL